MMTDIAYSIAYRTVGDVTRHCSVETFRRRMESGLFDSNEVIFYRMTEKKITRQVPNHYHTIEEKQDTESPARAERVPLP